ncbi:hypothetical protein K7X08_024775 [Anisodus acutangulus]|uniref:Pentatricopeptide repeat-containing protein n=1 Tax=Anisodus acutangulus TaxID=402998 RepID=A0A9Q1MAK1_9SOLA|nr:hypothetical protein K7X08_024773 [Anisodus acutangulus]KAJ8554097.1 hypothetical protein K7X08_024775 [Anisodus acutangulus]
MGNALVDMYAKCEKFEEANRIFANLAYRSSVPWTAIISIYVKKGFHEEALKMFKEMNRENIHSDQTTFASTLRASANLSSVSLGKQLPSSVIRLGLLSSVFSGSVLVDIIHKNQDLAKKAADQLFQMDALRDGAAYVNMSNIYAEAGKWENAAKVKKDMREQGVKKVTAYSWVEIC